MARKVVQVAQTTALTDWEKEMEAQAAIAAGMASSTGGAFFSVRAGQLSFDGMPLPGNQMAVVVLDWILENVYYEGEFDADNPMPPTCFAFGRDNEMKPHDVVFEADQAQHPTCRGCPKNEWGSAERGRGKACRNVRRLALIPAGTIDIANDHFTAFTDPDQFNENVGYLKVPVTSGRGFDTYVKQVAGALRRPPHGVFTRVRVKPDPKTQVAVTFEPLAPVPNELIGLMMNRHNLVAREIEQPYALTREDAPAPTQRKPVTRGRR
jgi:hypothetical protein